MKDNRIETTVKRLQEYRSKKDWEGIPEAEKALKKHHYSFDVVYQSALLYSAFGFESGDKELLQRALELLERSLPLLPQNEDPEISEQTVYGKIAQTYLNLDELDKGIALLKKHNAGGLYNCEIGHTLALCEHTEEAVPYLSEALAKIINDLCDTVIGYMNVFVQRSDYVSAETILKWSIEVFWGLRADGKPNFLDKASSILLASLAGVQLLSGKENEACETLKKATERAAFFDASPSYDVSDIRFIDHIKGASSHDDIGATAREAVENVARGSGIDELAALWESISVQENINTTEA